VIDQYLSAFLTSLKAGMLESWLAGKLSLQVEQDARGYIHAMTHLQRLSLADLQLFWDVQPVVDERKRRDSSTGYS
jgi:hypothetical protein